MTRAATFFPAKLRCDTSGDFQTSRNLGAARTIVVAAATRRGTDTPRMLEAFLHDAMKIPRHTPFGRNVARWPAALTHQCRITTPRRGPRVRPRPPTGLLNRRAQGRILCADETMADIDAILPGGQEGRARAAGRRGHHQIRWVAGT